MGGASALEIDIGLFEFAIRLGATLNRKFPIKLVCSPSSPIQLSASDSGLTRICTGINISSVLTIVASVFMGLSLVVGALQIFANPSAWNLRVHKYTAFSCSRHPSLAGLSPLHRSLCF